MSNFITVEQISFMERRQIQDVIRIEPEMLHSINCNTQKSCILKVDLCKFYDCIDSEFILPILIKMGMSSQNYRYVMGCLRSTIFSMIINGLPSKIFSGFSGPRQCFVMSPLFFLLVIDTLSRKVRAATDDGLIKRVRVSKLHWVTYLMFVDDLLFGSQIYVEEWAIFHNIIKPFRNATSLNMNGAKSNLIHK